MEPNINNQERSPKNYRTWVFLLAGMVTTAVLYLFYDNWSAPEDDSTKISIVDSFAITPAISPILANEEKGPSAYVGIEAMDIYPTIASQLDVSSKNGVLITSVMPGSPAEMVGLKRSDVIIAFNNRTVNDLDGLRALISDVEPSDVVRVVYIREGIKRSAYVGAGTAPDIEQLTDLNDSSDSLHWGMTVAPLTGEIKGMYDIPESIEGVVILSVISGGKADSVGIRQGDVIQGLGENKIIDMKSFSEAVYSDSDEISLLDIYSQGRFRYVSIESLKTDDPCVTQPFLLEGLDSYTILFQSVPLVGIIGLVFAMLCYFSLFKYSPGDAKMQAIAEKIHSGTVVFLKQEYKITAIFLIISFLAICFTLCLPTALAFLAGSVCSMLPGWIGMKAATASNSRTCQAAKKSGLRKALNVAFLGGSVMGISVASVGIIGLGTYSLLVLNGDSPETLPYVVAGFCLGASFFALFGRVGGGIFTKSADIGADMTGKIEYNLPEDDPRNPAVIADNVGDNVGDVAGMGSDLFESYISSTVATIIMALRMGELKYVILPLVLIAVGLICSLLSIAMSKFISRRVDPQAFLRNVIYVANALFLIGAFVAIMWITGEFSLFLTVAMGVLCGILIGIGTEYFGSGLPIRYIVKMSKTGPATNIIAGLAVGFIGALLPIIAICATIIITLFLAGLYGIGLSAVAMLSTMAIIMSIDAYGPIVDNAGGIATMSRAGIKTRRITDKLDAAGNITAAIGKGFTIGAGVITTVALFAAYIGGTKLAHAELFTPAVLVGLFIGAALPLLFAAWTMGAVTRIANKLVVEVRRQFKETKGILTGHAEPDTDRCVDVIARDSLMAAVVAGLIAIAVPFAVAFTLGAEALGGFLVGAMLVGSVLGLSMSIGGGAWDNAKKWIESHREKDDDMEVAYKSALVGDMVGDPFKDVSGPAMNILIKLMVTIALVFCSILCSV